MKAFFAKIWAWVLAHKLIAGIIAGATVVVLTVAIAVPCGVSASRKKKAAQDGEQDSTPAHVHTFSDEWSRDATTHFHAATCGHDVKADEAKHTFGAWTVVSETTEERSCTVCGYKEEQKHTHTYATAWSHDETNHWHACTGCTEKNDVEAHKFGAWTVVSGEKEERTCSTCGYKEEKNHVHTFADAWESDAVNHWHESTCGHDVKGSEAAHTPDANGFCTVCGAFAGPTFAFTDNGDYLGFLHEQMDMTANQVYFCCISGAVSGHIYELGDGDPVGGDPGTNYDDAIVAYTMIDGLPNLVDLSGDIPSEIGSDGYLYIKLDASNLYDRDDVFFTILQSHAPNDFGFCSVDNYYCGLPRTVGVSTNFTFKSGRKVFLRYEAVKGHQYGITHGGGLTGPEINAYYISPEDGSFVIIPNIKIDAGGVFPADAADSYIYVVITPSSNYSGNIRVDFKGHGGLDDHGFCVICGEYGGKPVDGLNIPTINLEENQKDYYRFPIKQHFAYELEDSTPEMTDGVTKGYLHLSTGFEEYEFDMANYIEDVGDGYMYLVINCTYITGISNGELTIHDYEEPIDSYGFYDICHEFSGEELAYNVAADPITVGLGEYKFFKFNLSNLPANESVLEITYTSGGSSTTCIGHDSVRVYYIEAGAMLELSADDWYGGNWDVEYYPTSGITTDDGYVYIVIHATRSYTNSPGFMVSSVEE